MPAAQHGQAFARLPLRRQRNDAARPADGPPGRSGARSCSGSSSCSNSGASRCTGTVLGDRTGNAGHRRAGSPRACARTCIRDLGFHGRNAARSAGTSPIGSRTRRPACSNAERRSRPIRTATDGATASGGGAAACAGRYASPARTGAAADRTRLQGRHGGGVPDDATRRRPRDRMPDAERARTVGRMQAGTRLRAVWTLSAAFRDCRSYRREASPRTARSGS